MDRLNWFWVGLGVLVVLAALVFFVKKVLIPFVKKVLIPFVKRALAPRIKKSPQKRKHVEIDNKISVEEVQAIELIKTIAEMNETVKEKSKVNEVLPKV